MKIPDELLAELERASKARRVSKSVLCARAWRQLCVRALGAALLVASTWQRILLARSKDYRAISRITEIPGWLRGVTERVGLLDTGPLVSFLSAGLEYHAWAVEQWKELRPPLLTCEPVLTEAAFLLKRKGRDTDALFSLLERGVIRIAIAVEREQAHLRALMRRYRNRPMSLADACLVRLSETHRAAEVVTLDADFRIYRRHGNKVIPVRMPD